eukprot:TRINITY_DN5720_c0_g3_i1.p1 TRINITY_DN5720_c0_g3~~TRINITY_DN5720_c0_g3_i1.p1  ORF type:complete len:705 (+),score=161.40 TRINITY_DN5720_c0_g3_i1:72-2117(+)
MAEEDALLRRLRSVEASLRAPATAGSPLSPGREETLAQRAVPALRPSPEPSSELGSLGCSPLRGSSAERGRRGGSTPSAGRSSPAPVPPRGRAAPPPGGARQAGGSGPRGQRAPPVALSGGPAGGGPPPPRSAQRATAPQVAPLATSSVPPRPRRSCGTALDCPALGAGRALPPPPPPLRGRTAGSSPRSSPRSSSGSGAALPAPVDPGAREAPLPRRSPRHFLPPPEVLGTRGDRSGAAASVSPTPADGAAAAPADRAEHAARPSPPRQAEQAGAGERLLRGQLRAATAERDRAVERAAALGQEVVELRARVAVLETALEQMRTEVTADLSAALQQVVGKADAAASNPAEARPTASPQAAGTQGLPTPPGSPSREQGAGLLAGLTAVRVTKPGRTEQDVPVLLEGRCGGAPVELLLVHKGPCAAELRQAHEQMVDQLRRISEGCPALLGVRGLAELGGGLYAVAARLERGSSLRDYARARSRAGRPFTGAEVLHVAQRAAEALSALHECDTPHRDLSGHQIVVEGAEGGAELGGGQRVFVRRYGLTRAPPLMEYTSPEAAEHRSFSAPNDLWSLGAVLWELVQYAAARAFRAAGQAELRRELLERAASGEPVFRQPASCPPKLWGDVIAPCFLPEGRRPGAGELARRVRAAQSDRWLCGTDIPIPDLGAPSETDSLLRRL